MSTVPVITLPVESNVQQGYPSVYALSQIVSSEPVMGLYLSGGALNSGSSSDWYKNVTFKITMPITMNFTFAWVAVSGSTYRIQVYRDSTGEKVLDKVSADVGAPWAISNTSAGDSLTFFLTNLTGVLNVDVNWGRLKGYAVATTAQTDVNLSAVSAGVMVPFYDNTVVNPTTGHAVTTFTDQFFSANTNYILAWVNSAATANGTSLVELSNASSVFNNQTKIYDTFVIGETIYFIVSTGAIGGTFTGTITCKFVSGGTPGSSTLVRCQGVKC